MSENGREGSTQPSEASTSTQSIRHQADTHFIPGAWLGARCLGDKKIFLELLYKLLDLQQMIKGHLRFLIIAQMQGLQLEKEKVNQFLREQESVNTMIADTVNFIRSEAMGQEHHLPLDLRGIVTGGQPDQPSPGWNEFQATFVNSGLSDRGIDIYNSYCLGLQDCEDYQRDKYDKTTNSSGILNLGICENKLCLDVITERLRQCDMNCADEDLMEHPKWRGQPFLREEVAEFLSYYCKTPALLDAENVVILNSCVSVFSVLAMVLCNPGEALLIPTPCYGGFRFSTSLYAKIELIPVHLGSEITGTVTYPFQLTVDKLEATLLDARRKGKQVRGLLLTNPHYPLGDVYSRNLLKEYLAFAKRHNLHVIINEIYMLSVFNETIRFHSVLGFRRLPDPNRTHVIWGTSKDFGNSGFYFGALYTHNKDVASTVSVFGHLHGVSGATQYILYQLLQDREWINNVYMPTNHSRLREAHAFVTKKLKAWNIPFLHHGSGFCIWMNLKAYLDPCTFEEELFLHRRFLNHKLWLPFGSSYKCVEPGWFCLVFAEKLPRLKVAMHRFHQALQEQRQEWMEKQLEIALRE